MEEENLKERKTKKSLVVAKTATKNPEKNNVETQVRWAEEKAEELDVEIKNTISVNGMSAHRFTNEYMKIIIDIIQKEKITYLLVHNFSRLSRNHTKDFSFVNELINWGSTIVTKHTVIDSDFFREIPLVLMVIGDAE